MSEAMQNKTLALLIILAAAAGPVGAADGQADAGVAAIDSLGRFNGQALACGAAEQAARAKELMLKHAPRTPLYGTTFEQATQRGFMDQVKSGQDCPTADEFAKRGDTAAAQLSRLLPAAP